MLLCILCLLPHQSLAISQITIFRGNWTHYNSSDSTAPPTMNTFKFGYQPTRVRSGINTTHPLFIASATFKNSTNFRFAIDRFTFIGYQYSNDTFFFFAIPRSKNPSYQRLALYIDRLFSVFNITENSTTTYVHNFLLMAFNYSFHQNDLQPDSSNSVLSSDSHNLLIDPNPNNIHSEVLKNHHKNKNNINIERNNDKNIQEASNGFILDDNNTIDFDWNINDPKYGGSSNPFSYDGLSSLVTIGFKIIDTEQPSEVFMMPLQMNGTILFSNISIELNALKFHYRQFISESKIYGVISSIIIALTFYAWLSIAYIQSSRKLRQLSVISYLINMSFEFNYGNLLLNYCISYTDLTTLYCLLFLMYSVIFFTLQSIQIFRIWRCSSSSLNTAVDNMRLGVFIFFIEIVLLMLIYLIAVYFMFVSPFWPLLLIIVSGIPQIIKSAYNDTCNKADNVYVVMITLSRLIIFGYHYIYAKSISGYYSFPIFLFATLGQLLVSGTILLQNKLGGAFFIPRFLKPRGYDYHGHNINPEEECPICMTSIGQCEDVMTTPCNHAFHKECLERWMQEDMVCPVCRSNLPEPDSGSRRGRSSQRGRSRRIYE
ncbi:hypothetical protein TRFO_35172 [Tritrichomonas foetus]|uniref:RING-type E3 ubiquitin transferase n=1 Tax=Tritrichomonas foetus TaxID=1144522 RepID=A0A1J4JJB9_9EUKA|nr:hypothetical protein TRFO_35172 [Tritrichomonas foetus]|eukprot:OHS98431.1 hypothetical protein TRFO_35172 [Tritrichomonas foetus]